MKPILISLLDRIQKLANNSTFKYNTKPEKPLSAVTLESKNIDFYKPIYISFGVLEKSKIPCTFLKRTL